MKPFISVVQPHSDVLEGRLTMDVFAANLWEVFKKRGPDEYKDPHIFFKKTELTQGLKNLLSIVEKRLSGKGGDPVIQLQTPFGGGKTHALIALYHKAKEWKVNVVVIDGEALDPRETIIWEEIEKQLTGKVSLLKGQTSPGREKLQKLLSEHQPLLILMDEILQYTTKAASVKVGDSNLAAQFLAFIQELTGAVSILEKSVLVFSLPSSIHERYDESAEQLFSKLQKIVGRREKIFTPVEDEEVPLIIRRRLFTSIDEEKVKEIVNEFVEYAEKEKMLPEGIDKSTYRERFMKSYPFLPETIDVLYKRWGSYVTFQRTRGVLRLLALVVHSLKNSKIPYISLADFDLGDQDIRQELLKYPGKHYESVITQDITSPDSAAKRVDKALGSSYAPYFLGTKVATTIFMYSFPQEERKGATISEIKRACATPEITSSSIVVEAVDKLRESAFYLWEEQGRHFFTAQPNLNRILITKMESIKDTELKTMEKELLARRLGKDFFEVYMWPKNSRDVPDTPKLKLIVVEDQEKCREILDKCGTRPRVHKNTLIFLCPSEFQRPAFENALRKYLALRSIDQDKTLKLTPEQTKEVKEKLRIAENDVQDRVRDLYRIVLIPAKREFKEINLGGPTYGVPMSITREVRERLKEEDELVDTLSPNLLLKYLEERQYVETRKILETFLNTPGEVRVSSPDVLKQSIADGVRRGLFGLGHLEKKKPVVEKFHADAIPELAEGEIIISSKICKPPGLPKEEFQKIIKTVEAAKSIEEVEKITSEVETRLTPEQRETLEKEVERIKEKMKITPKEGTYRLIELGIEIPSGRLSDIMGVITYLRNKFDHLNIKVDLVAKNGEVSKTEYEDRILEALRQAGVRIEKEIRK